MHSSRRTFRSPPSSSSSSSSPSESPSKPEPFHSGRSRSAEGSWLLAGPRLTRQRKLRHVTDSELGLSPSRESHSWSGEGSPAAGGIARWSTSAVPQPLPLPELSLLQRRKQGVPMGARSRELMKVGVSREEGDALIGDRWFGNSSAHPTMWKCKDHTATGSAKFPSNSCKRFSHDKNGESAYDNFKLHFPVRSAPTSGPSSPVISPRRSHTGLPVVMRSRELMKVGLSREEGDGREAWIGDQMFRNSSAHPTIRKNKDCTATGLAKFPSNCCKGFPHDKSGESAYHNLRLKVPVRSAPASGLSSPVVSPRRSNTGDFLPFSYTAPQDFQVRPGLEVAVLDRLASCAPCLPHVKITPSPDHSPLHSPTPQSPCMGPKNPSGIMFSMHHNLLPEGSAIWPENDSHVNVHPLPLPPGALKPSQAHVVRHFLEEPNASSMKTQWLRGRLIGRGTFGSVYVATNRETGASCAMKEVDIIPDDPQSAECVKQLEQEIKVLRQLKHPNIVQYYGSDIIDDHLYIYLEYVHPGSINKYVRERCATITESVVRNFTRHILSGLAYLHSNNTVHRDIKGANLLVDAKGVVKLADFGMAKHLTGQGSVLSMKGSPYWMAPEVMLNTAQKNTNPELAFAVDIWSLGCTIIEMLNGSPPWSEVSGVAAMFKVLNKSPPIPETLSSEGKDFLRLCFRRNPAERPSAVKLLNHPFLRNSHEQNVSVSMQAFSGMALRSPRDWTRHKSDLRHISLGTQMPKGNLPYVNECLSTVSR
ncbi:mitogen-activated protein kinase kinase kinase 5-like isoform X2 [Malania oleifera]|uniref:mitogen-activated protein kinase kinase kinase 5-like isoform X2 n=1 Tax=Malania oleifera TaxID=397392 RepID=UPI0025AEA774|nr:mitogen-activated protein kinase kinase kinase 5-like isoform X2 [Malania oleifera]